MCHVVHDILDSWFHFVVWAFKSSYTVVPHENTCYHTKLFDTLRKTKHVFVNQAFLPLFIFYGRTGVMDYELKSNKNTLGFGRTWNLWMAGCTLFHSFFFFLSTFLSLYRKRSESDFIVLLCRIFADLTSVTYELFASMTHTLCFLTLLFIRAWKSHLR